jgi:non-specific serine/threonine protein kinase/serine/threonine-protein kinase
MYQHKNEQAEPFLREAADKMTRVLGDSDSTTLLAVCNLGYLFIREGKLDQALTVERDALARSRRALGEDHPVTLVATALNAMILEKQGAYAQSQQLLVPIDAAVLKAFTGSNLFLRGTYLMLLGKSHTGQGHYPAAEAALLDAQSILQQTHNVTHADDIRDCMRALVDLYTAWNTAEPGKGHDAKAAEWKRKLDALDAPSSPAPMAH